MQRTRWWHSIAAQVVLVVLVGAGLVAGLLVSNVRRNFAHDGAVAADLLRDRAGIEAGAVGAAVAPTSVTAQWLTGLLAHQPFGTTGASCSATLARLARGLTQSYVAVVDEAGLVRCSSAGGPAAEARTFAHEDLVRRVVTSRRTMTVGPFDDPLTGLPSLVTSVPLPGSSRSLLLVAPAQAALALERSDTRFPTFVADGRTSTVLARFPDDLALAATLPKGRALTAVVGGAGRTVTTRGADGQLRLYRTDQVPGTPYRIVVGYAARDAFTAARASSRQAWTLGGALVLLVLALGVLLFRGVARPASALQRSIRTLALDPDAPYAATSGPRELADIARALNDTADHRRRVDGLHRALLQHASDHLVVLDTKGTVTFIAPTAQRAFGLFVGIGTAELVSRVHPDDHRWLATTAEKWLGDTHEDLRVELRAFDLMGQLRHLDVRVQDMRSDQHVAGLVLTCRDITERRVVEETLTHQARHDPLTGLASKAAVKERLELRLDDPDALPVCVLFIDIDRFKLVNDSHGHAVGDMLLVSLAARLRDALRPSDLVGRFGGDDFVVVTEHVTSEEAALELADRIRETLEEPVPVGRRELFVSGSVGVLLADLGEAADSVLRNAETAMYRAKTMGRNCAVLYDDSMRSDAQRLLRTENDLHRALERGQLALHFQPVLDLTAKRFEAVEALVRWEHPRDGLVPPSGFIPVAEETGLIVPIGEWVLRESCSWAARTGQLLGTPLRVAVNVSPRQLAQPDIVDVVDRALTDAGLEPERLCLEVTESLLVQDADVAARALTALHQHGVRLSIDDFGTGWSSLTYLQQFPVDEIKLDRSYVSRVGTDGPAAAIVAALVRMAHSMGLSVVAEGVETDDQVRFLNAHACDLAQGYLFARPVPGHEAERLLVGDAYVAPATVA